MPVPSSEPEAVQSPSSVNAISSTPLRICDNSAMIDVVEQTEDASSSIFFGVVHPQGGGWHLEQPIEMAFEDGLWTLLVSGSQFRVVVAGVIPDDIKTFLNEVTSITQGCLDGLGFLLGATLTAELTGGFVPPNIVIVRQHAWPELANTDSLNVSGKDLGPYVRCSITTPEIRLALADLGLALSRPDDTPFYCYRAVESIRQWLMRRDGIAESHSWPHLRKCLGFTEAELKELASASRRRRHGAADVLGEPQRLRLLKLAREVVRKAVAIADVSPESPSGDE